jgi:hypothetical protein
MRAHLYKSITNISGDVQAGVVVRLLEPDSDPLIANAITDAVFASKTGTEEVGTTFTITDGTIDIWLDISQYVMLGLKPSGFEEYFIDNVAVLAPGAPSDPTTPPTTTVFPISSILASIIYTNAGDGARADAATKTFAWNLGDVSYGEPDWATLGEDEVSIALVPGVYSYNAKLTGKFDGSTKPAWTEWMDYGVGNYRRRLVGTVETDGTCSIETSTEPTGADNLMLGPSWDWQTVTDPGFTGVLEVCITRWNGNWEAPPLGG